MKYLSTLTGSSGDIALNVSSTNCLFNDDNGISYVAIVPEATYNNIRGKSTEKFQGGTLAATATATLDVCNKG